MLTRLFEAFWKIYHMNAHRRVLLNQCRAKLGFVNNRIFASVISSSNHAPMHPTPGVPAGHFSCVSVPGSVFSPRASDYPRDKPQAFDSLMISTSQIHGFVSLLGSLAKTIRKCVTCLRSTGPLGRGGGGG